MDSITHSEHVQVEETPSELSKWHIFGYKTPKREVVYFSQTIMIYIVVMFCLIMLALERGTRELWVALLGSCLGYLLPHPSLENGSFLRHTSKQ